MKILDICFSLQLETESSGNGKRYRSPRGSQAQVGYLGLWVTVTKYGRIPAQFHKGFGVGINGGAYIWVGGGGVIYGIQNRLRMSW